MSLSAINKHFSHLAPHDSTHDTKLKKKNPLAFVLATLKRTKARIHDRVSFHNI